LSLLLLFLFHGAVRIDTISVDNFTKEVAPSPASWCKRKTKYNAVVAMIHGKTLARKWSVP
jgi:hypothetical protein